MRGQNFLVQRFVASERFKNSLLERAAIGALAHRQDRAESHMQNLAAGILIQEYILALLGRKRRWIAKP